MDFSMIVKGGVTMIPLLSLSVYALAVCVYKALQFAGSRIFDTRFIVPVMEHVKRGELTDAELKLRDAKGPVALIMKVAITCVTNRDMSLRTREAEIARVGSAEIRKLETHMRGLEMVATTSPLLGLLGTVTGMVAVFATLSDAGSRVDPALLAGGIWEALITTVTGLVIAVPAVAAYYVIDGIIEKVRATMRDVTVQILSLEDEYMRNEKEQEKRELMERERKLRELQEAQERALEQVRTTAQSSSTLRLLSPSYNRI
jgi:biopolymer transport protein ExbB